MLVDVSRSNKTARFTRTSKTKKSLDVLKRVKTTVGRRKPSESRKYLYTFCTLLLFTVFSYKWPFHRPYEQLIITIRYCTMSFYVYDNRSLSRVTSTVRLSILAKSIYMCTTSMSRSSEEMKFSRIHRNFEFQEYSKRLKNIHGTFVNTQSQSKQLTVQLSACRRRDPFLFCLISG